MQAEQRHPQALLEIEAAQIITRPQRVGQRQDRISAEVAMVKDGALADPETAGFFFFHHGGANAGDQGGGDARLLVEMQDPGVGRQIRAAAGVFEGARLEPRAPARVKVRRDDERNDVVARGEVDRDVRHHLDPKGKQSVAAHLIANIQDRLVQRLRVLPTGDDTKTDRDRHGNE